MTTIALGSPATVAPERHTSLAGSILVTVAALVALGVVMVYSATLPHGDVFLRRQVVWVVVGAATLAVLACTPYRALLRAAPLLFGLALALLVAAYLPGLGEPRNGAHRWVRLGPQVFQPSEVARLALVLFLARHAAARREALREFRGGFLPPAAAIGLVSALVLFEPDVGSAVFLATVGLATLLVAGVRPLHLALTAAALLPAVGLVAWTRFEHVERRLAVFLDPGADPTGAAWQINQALIAQGNGGWLGVGLGRSLQKFGYLPEAHTDFVFAIVGEELGLAGTLATLGAFALLVTQGMRVVRRAPDLEGLVLAFGLSFMIGLQALMNVAVVTASVPTKGIGLPFVSYGGSSLVMTLAAVGILMNVARHAETASRAHAHAHARAHAHAHAHAHEHADPARTATGVPT